MKKYHPLLPLFILLSYGIQAQNNLVFQGTVKCYIANDPNATKGAKNIIVIPGFIPVKTGITGSQGYYEINTGISLEKLEGKYIAVYYISSCKTCEKKKNIFISEDQMKTSEAKHLSYFTIETMLMKGPCRNTELQPLQSDSMVASIIRQPAEDLEKMSSLNVLTASPGFLNLLSNVATLAAVGGGGSFEVDTTKISFSKIKGYGNFLFASPMGLSGNTGFNFSPNRNLSEAVLWNPSALANTYNTGGVNFFTNLKNNHKFAAYAKLTEKVTLGIGGLYTKQEEFRTTAYRGPSSPTFFVLHLRNLKEYAAYLSPALKVNEKFSVGLGLKSIWQEFNVPDSLTIIQSGRDTINNFTDRIIKTQHFDVDVSATYAITPSFKVGINIMNIAGTELFKDAIAAKKKIVPMQNLRSLGIGLCYKVKQFNFGTDILATENGLYDVSLGANFVPFNNALIAAGYAFNQQSFTASFRMKFFSVTYINDNGLLVSDRRKGSSSLFNGQLYSGLTLTF